MEIHVKTPQNLHARRFAYSLSSTDTTALLLHCVDSGETVSGKGFFLQLR